MRSVPPVVSVDSADSSWVALWVFSAVSSCAGSSEPPQPASAPVNSMDIARSAANFFFMIDILL